MASGQDIQPVPPGAVVAQRLIDSPPGSRTRFPKSTLESAPDLPEEEDDYFPELLAKSGADLEAAGGVAWARPDRASPCYGHLLIAPGADTVAAPKTFALGKAEIEYLIAANRYQPKGENDIIAFGIRGAQLRDEEKAENEESVALEDARPDHRNFRCVVGFYFRGTGKLSAYTASTVPWHRYMTAGKKNNLLPTGCYIYKKGDHVGSVTVSPALRLSDAEGSHSGLATVLRTRNDLVFGVDDVWDVCNPSDNIHCAFSDDSFSSLGCQTIKGPNKGDGLWADFQSTIDELPDDARVDYVLVTGAECSIAAALIKAGVPPQSADALRRLGRLRTGSEGEEVKRLQEKLGVEPTGYFGAKTKKRLTEVQAENKLPADGIYSPAADAKLGWAVFMITAPPQPTPPPKEPQPAAAAAPQSTAPAAVAVATKKPDGAVPATAQAPAENKPVSAPVPVQRPDPVVVSRPSSPDPQSAVPPMPAGPPPASEPAGSRAVPSMPADPAAGPPLAPGDSKPSSKSDEPDGSPASGAPPEPKTADAIASSKPAPPDAAPPKPAAPAPVSAQPAAKTEPDEEPVVKLTVESLQKFAPKARAEYMKVLGTEGNGVLSKFEINENPLRLCHFMAQVGHECGGFTITSESLKYSAERMVEIFGPGRHSARLGPAEARTLVGREEAFAERVYGLGNPSMARNLGNTEPGDGYRYRGRGFLQITGRAAYREMGKRIGIDLEADPDKAAEPLPALMSAAAFWDSRGLNGYADEDDIVLITKRINGGRNGLDDRERRFEQAKKIWGESLESVVAGKLESVAAGPRLELGSCGAHVARLKQLLRQNDYGPLAHNEDFDRATHLAVVRFKLDHGLPGDGVVTPQTWERLEVMAGKAKKRGEPRSSAQESVPAGQAAADGLRRLKSLKFWGSMLLLVAAIMALIRAVNAAVPLSEGWQVRQFEFALIALIAIAGVALFIINSRLRKAWLAAAMGSADVAPLVENSDVDLGIRPAVNIEQQK